MPPEAPTDDREYLDWAFDRALELIEDGQEAAAEELLLHRPAVEPQVRDLIGLARRVAFGPRAQRPRLRGYIMLDELGQGGMGTVWLAQQERLGGRLVAVKVLSGALGLSPHGRARFRAEARIIAKLRHPNIVDVYDVIEEDGIQAYAMEWIEGSTLARVIERVRGGDASLHGQESSMAAVLEALGATAAPDGRHSTPDRDRPSSAVRHDRSYIVFITRLGAAIARALGEVHRAGLVHRDVKPSNILLRRDGTPLLSDFGLARDDEATLVTRASMGPSIGGGGSFAGTAAFAAPEQLRADGGAIDGRADIYALGATLYSALALRAPFHGRSHVDVLRQIQLGLFTPPRRINPKLPRDLQTIVMKAMEHDPARRYQTADELADDLERLLSLQPIRARPVGPVARLLKAARRNRSTIVAATIGAVLVTGIMAAALVYFIGFPAWSKARLNEARLTLLDPEQADTMFSGGFWGLGSGGGLPIDAAALDRAIGHYRAAARFAPFDDELALERDLVRMAREITQRPEPGEVHMPRSPDDLPLCAAFAASAHSGWRTYGTKRGHPELTPEALASASTADLRALGLVALLCGESGMAMNAWAAHDLRGGADPMIEASFGIMYLIRNEYGRAYPRLRNAVIAFPDVGFLTVYLAEAAAKCGDLEKAQHWLDDARDMQRHDRFGGWKRVQAGLYERTGRENDARRLYEELFAENQNIVAFDQYARFLEARGDVEAALPVYLRILGQTVEWSIPGMRERFVSAVERWWQGLSKSERAAQLGQSSAHLGGGSNPSHVLPVYLNCLSALGLDPPPDGLPRALPASDGKPDRAGP
jgi:serine/threonine protein kinase